MRRILPLFPPDIQEYREPMVGGGSVFLAAREEDRARRYWINDLFPDLVAFWQTVQSPEQCQRLRNDLERLRRELRTPEAAKAFFLSVREEQPADPYRRAFLFFFFNRVTFSGTTRAGGFSREASVRRFTLSSIQRLEPLPEVLIGVRITSLDFADVIAAPGKGVFLFLDPPYFTIDRLYGRKGQLHEFDHGRLAEALRNTRHRFLMTYDDCPEVRDLYWWAETRSWTLQYGMSNCNRENRSRVGAELFIANYPLPAE